jgi:hypothetical protein
MTTALFQSLSIPGGANKMYQNTLILVITYTSKRETSCHKLYLLWWYVPRAVAIFPKA